MPAAAAAGGPLVDADGTTNAFGAMPAKHIALTFDDGPDPVWTPQILDVLREQHVPATFFVVGSQVARHPDLATRIAAWAATGRRPSPHCAASFRS